MNWLKRIWYKNDVLRWGTWVTILSVTGIALAATIAFAIVGMVNVLTIIVKIVTCLGGVLVLSGLAATLID